MDYTVHGILQARILECVDFPFSRRSSQPRDRNQVSRIAGGFFISWATSRKEHSGNAGDAGSEEEVATHSSLLAWRRPWTEEPSGLQSKGSQSGARLRDWTHIHIGSTTYLETNQRSGDLNALLHWKSGLLLSNSLDCHTPSPGEGLWKLLLARSEFIKRNLLLAPQDPNYPNTASKVFPNCKKRKIDN